MLVADGLWHRIVARVREASWASTPTTGSSGIAGILQGFASAGVGDRLLIFAAVAGTLAGAGLQTMIAFTVGAMVPLLFTWFVPLAIEIRSLTVGLGTMGASYLAGMFFC